METPLFTVEMIEGDRWIIDSEWKNLNEALHRASFCLNHISDNVKITREKNLIIQDIDQ